MLPRRRPTNMLGKQPTNSQKLIYIASKLGLNGIKDMQGSTVNIFDTVSLVGGSLPTVLEFFSNTANKARSFSNFQNGSLNSGETLVMEEIKFYLIVTNNSNLSDPATVITAIHQLSARMGSIMPNAEGLQMAQMSISIANQTVVKDYMICETNPSLNPATSGIANQLLPNALVPASTEESLFFVGNSIIRLEAPPVLPPNQKLKVSLEIPALGGGSAQLAIVCVIGKFGSIYASKTTL